MRRWNPNEFEYLKVLNENFEDIRKELQDLLDANYFQPYDEEYQRKNGLVQKSGDWKTFFLYNRGVKVKENCLRCPKTSKLVESLPRYNFLS